MFEEEDGVELVLNGEEMEGEGMAASSATGEAVCSVSEDWRGTVAVSDGTETLLGTDWEETVAGSECSDWVGWVEEIGKFRLGAMIGMEGNWMLVEEEDWLEGSGDSNKAE